MNKSLVGSLPDNLKAAIRPFYRRVFQGKAGEKESNLAIDSFGSFEIAFRRGTTDRIIIDDAAAIR